MAPTVVTQVAPPHTWFGMDVGGSRIFYDNPDTIYRFMSVNKPVVVRDHGPIPRLPRRGFRPTRPSACWRGLAGTTSSILTADDLEIGH